MHKALVSILAVAALSACGSSSSAAVATPSPVPSLTVTGASRTCPTAARVNAALGTNVQTPVGVAGSGGAQIPAGAKGTVCEYPGKSENVIIILITNIDPTYISKFSDRFPVPYKSVSGVGDQARSFQQALGGGKDNEGVVATKGQTLVDITATATPASLAQLEALVGQLL